MLVVAAVGVAAWSLDGSSGHKAAAPPQPRTTTSTSTTAATTTTTTRVVLPPYEPPAVKPLVSPALAGEGTWVKMDRWDPGPPSVLTTTFRPDPSDTSIVAYVAWMRTSTTQIDLYPGYEGPGPTTLDRGPEMVPESAWPRLLATFNSGFYEADEAAGFYTHGTLYFPMVKGEATVVAYSNGRVAIVDWEAGPRPGPGIVMARQNLPLLVNDGAPTPATADPSLWGITLGGVPAVWRTGLGVDAKGNLIYVAAADQTAATLAQVLVDVGAVRGMQLDINPEWPIYVTYGGSGAASPSLFVPNPNSIPNRFLFPATKDFFAVYRRVGGDTAQPW
ncbi:MAG: phosphodiester glycosidase family protein [Acidimicrobiales bacterium]